MNTVCLIVYPYRNARNGAADLVGGRVLWGNRLPHDVWLVDYARSLFESTDHVRSHRADARAEVRSESRRGLASVGTPEAASEENRNEVEREIHVLEVYGVEGSESVSLHSANDDGEVDCDDLSRVLIAGVV